MCLADDGRASAEIRFGPGTVPAPLRVPRAESRCHGAHPLCPEIAPVESHAFAFHPEGVNDEVSFFAYGSLMHGEVHDAFLVDGFRVGPARTTIGYRLVDLGQYPAMIVGGEQYVEGELYRISRDCLFKIDELKENGRLFHRRSVELSNGEHVEAYLMDEDKLRGRRRLRGTDWRRRFERPHFGSRSR